MQLDNSINPSASNINAFSGDSLSAVETSTWPDITTQLPPDDRVAQAEFSPVQDRVRTVGHVGPREMIELPGSNIFYFHPVAFAQNADWTQKVADATDRAQREQTARYADTVRQYNEQNGTNLRDVYELSRHTGYADSELFQTFAAALSARSNRVITPEQAFLFDPFGGLPGPGPETYHSEADIRKHALPNFENVEFTGVSIPHDTDYIIGRFFGMGPLAGIADLPSQQGIGNAGLIPYPLLPGWIRDAFPDRNTYPNYIFGTSTGWSVSGSVDQSGSTDQAGAS